MTNKELELEHAKVEHLIDTITKPLYKRINELENIINELKNGIKKLDEMFYETFRISQNGYYSISKWALKNFTDKIKELEEK